MKRIYTATQGIESWRQRLASPGGQWKRRYSAFETAVSWEYASRRPDGLPAQIAAAFATSPYHPVTLFQAIAEHKVPLPGGNACSQSDVWAILKTPKGDLSLTVEGKAKEKFGDHALGIWLDDGKSERAKKNRAERWQYIANYLPSDNPFDSVRYQLLHRCASAVIEAARLGIHHAAFLVQAFHSPPESFTEFERLCAACKVEAKRGTLSRTFVEVDGRRIELSMGWVDCGFSTDSEVALTAS